MFFRRSNEQSHRRRRKWRRTWSRLSQPFVSAFEMLVLPILKLVFTIPNVLIGLFHERGVETETNSRRRKRKREKLWKRVLRLPIQALLLPHRLFIHAQRRGKTRELLYFVPAILIAIFFAFVWYQNAFRYFGLHSKYLARTRQAVESNQLMLAKMYFHRILQDQDSLSDAQALHWAVILDRTGDETRAQAVLDRIAPDNEKGYEPAHRVKAIAIAQEYIDHRGSLNHEALKFHLEHSGSQDAEVRRAWAIYYQSLDQPEKAIAYLNEASKTFPELYLTVAEIAEQIGKPEARQKALASAKFDFEKRLAEEPLDVASRVALAKTLIKLKDFDAAEYRLLEGMSIQPTSVLRRSLSNLFLIRFDEDETDKTFPERVNYIKQAIEFDISSERPYEKLVEITGSAKSHIDIDDLKLNFQKAVTKFGSGALDHCNLAHMHYRENNLSEMTWHLEQAWRIDPLFGRRAHHLAMAYAKSKSYADTDWAMKLSRMAATKAPKETVYREGLGELHLIRGEYQEAISVLTETLKDTANSVDVHKQLAFAFHQQGQFKRAGLHTQKAREAEYQTE